jgi:UDP-glucose:(heptosyl)LPS alpha-1,3-glucosyltransferase
MTKKVFISQKDLIGIYSGVQRKVHEEIRYFAKHGFKVYVCAERINTDAVLKSGGIPTKTFRWPFSGLKRRLNYLKRAETKIKKIQPDLIIGHGDIVKQDICYIHNCVHLAHKLIHKIEIPENHEVGVIHSKILTEQNFKLLVCNSKLMQNDLTKRFNIPLEKSTVIYPEYSPKKFQKEDQALRENTRNSLDITDEFVIGLVTSGNFKKRNVDGLLKAAANLNGNFKILIAGKDKSEKFIQQSHELGIADKVMFARARTDVEAYYHAIDLFVLPAWIEEFGRSVLEAMGCSKPVIVSDTVGASELLRDKSSEFIIKADDTIKFTGLMQKLIDDSQLCLELAQLNYQIASENTDLARANDFSHMLSAHKII